MSILSAVSFNWKVNVLGKAFLRFERRRGEWKMRKPYKKQNPNLAPLLKSVPYLKELISTHYLHGRYADTHKKVAWVTSGAPVEILKALDYFTLYPENHGAVCGVRRQVVELSGVAENMGYNRDLCSYARGDLGSVVSGKTPVGRLPKPDLLFCCTNICQTVMYWYQVLADHFKVPLIMIDTPFIYDKVTEHEIEYVKKQLEYAIATAERVAGKSISLKQYKKVGIYAKDAVLLWNEILDLCKHRPSPISAFDQFFYMAPIVDMRGEDHAVKFYTQVIAEVKQRIADGVGAVTNERKRLLWDNLPIWYEVRRFAEVLAEKGYCIAASTYTHAWGGDMKHIIESIDTTKDDMDYLLSMLASAYLHAILNQSSGYKLNVMLKMVKEYDLDGVILHNNRSCKPYSLGQIDQRDRLMNEYGIPTILLEADHNDPRSFSEEQAMNRLAAFIEIVENKK
ncbi:MAG: 2-hydroxyacyl-CoA dehydratase [Spirochaetes bacterium]|nr:2-hydroxyacyl-CoA dehydratase [Spirochaetota bacterium]